MQPDFLNKPFSFHSHSHKYTQSTLTGEYTVTLKVDEAEMINLAPLALIPFNGRLKVTLEQVE